MIEYMVILVLLLFYYNFNFKPMARMRLYLGGKNYHNPPDIFPGIQDPISPYLHTSSQQPSISNRILTLDQYGTHNTINDIFA